MTAILTATASTAAPPLGRRRAGRAWEGDAGSASLTLLLGLAFIVVPVILVVVSLPIWESRTVDARDVAAQAARTLVTADTWTAGVTAAQQLVNQEAANDGLNPADLSATFAGTLNPGGAVTATVTVTVPAGQLPGIGGIGTWHYTASSTQHVDTYRDSP